MQQNAKKKRVGNGKLMKYKIQNVTSKIVKHKSKRGNTIMMYQYQQQQYDAVERQEKARKRNYAQREYEKSQAKNKSRKR
jgi:hypothetical protein